MVASLYVENLLNEQTLIKDDFRETQGSVEDLMEYTLPTSQMYINNAPSGRGRLHDVGALVNKT